MALATRRGSAADQASVWAQKITDRRQIPPLLPLHVEAPEMALSANQTRPHDGKNQQPTFARSGAPSLQAAGPHHLVDTHLRRPSPVAATPALVLPP